MKTFVYQLLYQEFFYRLLSCSVRNYAHLTKNVFELFGTCSLAWRYKTANRKFLKFVKSKITKAHIQKEN